MAIDIINPSTEEVIETYNFHTNEEITSTLKMADEAQRKWMGTDYTHRATLMMAAAEQLRKEKKELADLMAKEMGKVLKDGEAEVEKCAWVCEYYAENAAKFLEDEIIKTDASKSFVSYQPLGVVLAIMPWNFPLWQVFRFAAPGLMAGNGGILKHSPNVTGCALAIEEIFIKAGFPENLFRTIIADLEQVAAVIKDPIIKAVTLTGSTRAGKSVAEQAGAVLKKCVLELGGSDPYVILDDADIDLAVNACATSRLINNGQSCIAAKRFIVTPKNQKEFTDKLLEKMSTYQFGDPFNESNQNGPMARKDLRDDLHKQVKDSIDAGAECLLGGEVPEQPGFFYPPTILTQVKKGMPAYDEEMFGPVASIIVAKDEDDALQIANDTIYGLGACVFTSDSRRGEELAATRLQAGACFVNSFVRSDPRLPFGGIKESGYGRELSAHGIREFVNAKTVYLA